MVSEKFRHQLRAEADKWLGEALIERNFYEQLAQRYQFNQLESSARNRFIMILLGIGSILLGLGIITFVAANWQVWSRELKVGVLLSVFIGVNIAGFYLWRRDSDGWQSRLGVGLLLLGGLILGSNIALMSQLFHQSGPIYQLYLIWGLGVLAMAYSLRLTPLAILGVILLSLGYFAPSSYDYIRDFYQDGQLSVFGFILQHLALLGTFVLIPLAYWCGSRWLFGLSAVLITLSLASNLLSLSIYVDSKLISAIALCLPPALLWAYQDSLWVRHPRENSVSLRPIARSLAIVGLSATFYSFSFNFIWTSISNGSWEETISFGRLLIVLIDALVLAALMPFAWWRLGQSQVTPRTWRLDFNSAVIALMIMTTGVLWWWHFEVSDISTTATIIFNLLLFLLGVGLVRQSLVTGKRSGFWLGILLLCLQIASRMLEYDTGLLFKAIVLLACGVGVILGGIWFERYLRNFSY